MANIVVVDGAWPGGWCYRDTARLLRAQGHTVPTPTHTGVGDRGHQAHEAITLETHVRDVFGVIARPRNRPTSCCAATRTAAWRSPASPIGCPAA
jgi:hypothetical protein